MRCVDKTQVSHGRSLPVFPYAAPAARHAWRAAWTLEYACDASFKRGAGVTTPSGCQAVRGSGSTRQSTTSLFGRCSACGKGAAAVRPDTGCAGALGALHSAALGATRTDCSPFPMVLHSCRLTRLADRPARLRAPRAAVQQLSMQQSSAASEVPVEIEVTGMNSRQISASIVVDASPAQVWSILTDYDNLATHVPNLVESSLRPHPTGGTRLFQEGAQKIVGFDFRASLVMDMTEFTDEGATRPTRIRFSLVESAMFGYFDGEWRVTPYSRVRCRTDPTRFDYKSQLSYRVNIMPKGLVPVPALEWRIREDVPVNLRAVKAAAEKLAATSSASLVVGS